MTNSTRQTATNELEINRFVMSTIRFVLSHFLNDAPQALEACFVTYILEVVFSIGMSTIVKRVANKIGGRLSTLGLEIHQRQSLKCPLLHATGDRAQACVDLSRWGAQNQ